MEDRHEYYKPLIGSDIWTIAVNMLRSYSIISAVLSLRIGVFFSLLLIIPCCTLCSHINFGMLRAFYCTRVVALSLKNTVLPRINVEEFSADTECSAVSVLLVLMLDADAGC